MMPLEPFVVNLVDPAGKRFLKLTLAVDIKEEKTKKEIESRLPQIRDAILLLLTSKGYNDIAQVAGKLRLRNDILRIINQALGASGQVHAVYFTEFVIQ
jgi:flagellar FliL protein